MTGRRVANIAAVSAAITVLWTAVALAAATSAEKCEAAKLNAASKYGACRLGAEKKAVLKAITPDYTKCDAKYATAWGKAETKYGAACPTSGDQVEVQTDVTDFATCLGGDLGGTPASCALGSGGGSMPLKTGQTQCDQGAGTLGPCPGSPAGQDAALSNGAAQQYVDNGDGTITDTKTGLMWEKLSNDGSIHDYTTSYTWYAAFTTKIATLNLGFAGHTDWRLPNLSELQSLANYGVVNPAIDPAFNTGCVASCTVTSCSCTQFSVPTAYYWSSTTYQLIPTDAWFVWFSVGGGSALPKGGSYYVRGVRGGS